MSWDIYIQDFPATAESVTDIPDDFQLRPLGKRVDLIAQILDVVPGADFSNPNWGVFEGDGYSIEFQMGSGQICGSITLLVRGGGNPAPLIAALLDRLKFRGIDCQTSEFFDVEVALASFGSWQRFRDQVLGSDEEKKDEG